MTLQLLVLAVVAMTALAVMRVIRVQIGRTPHPDGRARIPFILAFLILPPVAMSAISQPAAASGLMRGVSWVLPFIVLIAGVAIVMILAALFVRRLAMGGTRRTLLLALTAIESDLDDVAYDPPVTATLAAGVAGVDRANGVFPRGIEFPGQIDLAGFRYAWDTLDAATTTLEGRIADDRRLGIPIASRARAAAADARSRLDTLRQLAEARGQLWAT